VGGAFGSPCARMHRDTRIVMAARLAPADSGVRGASPSHAAPCGARVTVAERSYKAPYEPVAWPFLAALAAVGPALAAPLSLAQPSDCSKEHLMVVLAGHAKRERPT